MKQKDAIEFVWDNGLVINKYYCGSIYESHKLNLCIDDSYDLLTCLSDMLEKSPQQQILEYGDYQLWVSAFEKTELSFLILDLSEQPKRKICSMMCEHYNGFDSMINGIKKAALDVSCKDVKTTMGNTLIVEFERGISFSHWNEDLKKAFCDFKLVSTPEQAVPFFDELIEFLKSGDKKTAIRISQYLISVMSFDEVIEFAVSVVDGEDISRPSLYTYNNYFGYDTLWEGILKVRNKASSLIR